ncbi:MAG: hypothetical protein R2825_02115 [Saprospiraceae bacterium]
MVSWFHGFVVWKKWLIAGCLLLVIGAAFGQNSRMELEEKRKQLLREIEQTTRLLKQTKENRQATYSTYVTLQRQINRRLQLIETLQKEVLLILETVERTTGAVQALKDDVDRLKTEYAVMVRHAYRQKLIHNDWLFVLSATSFNDAFRRWQYLRQYDRYRQKQARLIIDTQETLLAKIGILEKRKIEKENYCRQRSAIQKCSARNFCQKPHPRRTQKATKTGSPGTTTG